MTSLARNLPAWVDRIEQYETAYDLFQTLSALAGDVGARRFAMIQIVGATQNFSDMSVVNNWDPELILRYDSLQVGKFSPIVRHIGQGTRGKMFNVDQLKKDPRCLIEKSAFDIFQDYRMTDVFATPVLGNGKSKGGLSFSSDRLSISSTDQLLLQLLGSYVFERFYNVQANLVGTRRQNEITDVERECLRKASAGYTSKQTAEALQLSEKSVEHAISSASKKLGTSNRLHTVVEAIRHGLLF